MFKWQNGLVFKWCSGSWNGKFDLEVLCQNVSAHTFVRKKTIICVVKGWVSLFFVSFLQPGMSLSVLATLVCLQHFCSVPLRPVLNCLQHLFWCFDLVKQTRHSWALVTNKIFRFLIKEAKLCWWPSSLKNSKLFYVATAGGLFVNMVGQMSFGRYQLCLALGSQL